MTGKVAQEAAETTGSLITGAKLRQLYAAMLHCRLLAEHASQRLRAAGTFPMFLGQEALTTGWIIDLRPHDTIAPALPDGMASLVQGAAFSEIAGLLFARRKAAEPSAQLKAAIAAATDHKRKKKSNVAVMFASADASKRAPWREALTLAVKRRLPLVFVVENNPWVPDGRAGEEEDGVPGNCGLPAITVDGNDVVAVYRVACESLQRVRRGDGPVLVEGKAYRAAGRRSLNYERDPLLHMERYLRGKKLFTAMWKNQLRDVFCREMAAASKAKR